jgi:Putative transposase, YhgA-like
MTKPPHDALFKSAFHAPAAAAALLRALVPAAVRAAVAWDKLVREDRSFVNTRLAQQHTDLLFSARLRTRKRRHVYFLLEHQSTRAPTMPRRMLSYHLRIWDRFVGDRPKAGIPPVITMLLSNARGGWKDPRAFEELFDPAVLGIAGLAALVPRCSMIIEDLMPLSNDDLAARPLAAFQKLALWLLRDARDSARLLDSFDAWSPAMLKLARTQAGRDNLETLITYMFEVIDPVYRDELHAKIRELGSRTEEVAMSIAEVLRKEGRKQGRKEGRKQGLKKGFMKGREEGREQGREQGRKEGRIATLRSLLVLRFQTLGAADEARLQAASPRTIDRYLQRLLTADSLAEVFED